MNKIILTGLTILIMTGCAGQRVIVQGVDVSWLEKRNWPKILVGSIASTATHELAHYGAAKLAGRDFRMNGLRWETDQEDAWVSRAGYLTQDLLGSFLIFADDDFALGRNTAAFASAVTYKLRWSEPNDFTPLSNSEYYLHVGWSSMNLGLSFINTVEED